MELIDLAVVQDQPKMTFKPQGKGETNSKEIHPLFTYEDHESSTKSTANRGCVHGIQLGRVKSVLQGSGARQTCPANRGKSKVPAKQTHKKHSW